MNTLPNELKRLFHERANKNLVYNKDLFHDIMYKEASKGNVDFRFNINNDRYDDGEIVRGSGQKTVYNLKVNDVMLFANLMRLEGFVVYEEEDSFIFPTNTLTLSMVL